MTGNNSNYFIGLDDTDFGDSIGTGALARELSIFLKQKLDAECKGITRHQFLIHPDIPYTSHNSSACLEVSTESSLDELSNTCRGFLRYLYHPGADPGLSIASRDQLTDAAVDFGRRAQREIVTKGEAIELAREAGIVLEEHGGTGLGVVGAFSGAVLRMDGNDGRLIAHRGIRDARDEMTVGELLSNTAVDVVVDDQGVELGREVLIETNNWVRPDLKENRAVLNVCKSGESSVYIVKKKKR